MPNELTYQFQTTLRNGNLFDTYSTQSLNADQASARLVRNVQNIGTAQEALELGDVVTPGFAVFSNLDSTNFVEIGIDVAATFHSFGKLKPGEQATIRLSTLAPFARADTAPVDLFYIIYED